MRTFALDITAQYNRNTVGVANTPRDGYGGTDGLRLVTQLGSEGLFIFGSDEARRAARAIGIADTRVSYLLSRLVAGGWLTRLRRGLFADSGRLPGGVAAPSFAVATALVAPSAISHWSALNYHGLTSQVPTVITATTPRRVITPSMRSSAHGSRQAAGRHLWQLPALSVEYVSIKPQRFFGHAPVWLDQHFRVPIMDKERTVLDLFAQPRHFGGIDLGLSTLSDHLGELDVGRLVSYALEYGSKAVCARLGWSLESVGAASDELKPLVVATGPGLQVLDPTRVRQGRRVSHWHLLDNVGLAR